MSLKIFSVVLLAAVMGAEGTIASSADSLKWLLEYSDRPTNAVIWDDRFDSLLAEFTQDVMLDIGLGGPHTIRENINAFVGGASELVIVKDNRYVIMSGCRYQSCYEKAWLWVDTEDGLVIGALIHYIWEGEYKSPTSIFVFSNNLASPPLPVTCEEDLKGWVYNNYLKIDTQRFLGSHGQIQATDFIEYLYRRDTRPPTFLRCIRPKADGPLKCWISHE